MITLDDLGSDGTLCHHAFLLVCERACGEAAVDRFLEHTLSFPVRANPDLYRSLSDVFGINDARAIKAWAGTKSLGGVMQVAVLSFSSATVEAQNALLKLLEEPSQETSFFLITPMASSLLPTVLSRLMQVECSQPKKDASVLAETFLKTSFGKRIALFDTIVENKDKALAASFLRDLERLLYEKTPPDVADETTQRAFIEIEQCIQYASDRSPSLKMLLDHISLVVPVVK